MPEAILLNGCLKELIRQWMYAAAIKEVINNPVLKIHAVARPILPKSLNAPLIMLNQELTPTDTEIVRKPEVMAVTPKKHEIFINFILSLYEVM